LNADSCRTIFLSSNGDNAIGHSPVARVNLAGDCTRGDATWEPTSSGATQVVQFYKNHTSFAVCLSSANSANFTISQLRGISRKNLVKRNGEELGCIKSHCNHISLLLTAKKSPLTAAIRLKYKVVDDYSCSRCSDSCMRSILCASDYVFIGSVVKVSLDENKYTNLVYVENYLRYNNTYEMESGKRCSRPPTPAALHADHPIPPHGMMTKVISQCLLKEGQKYFFGTSLKLGYLNKGKLMLGCAQQDIEFMLYHYNKRNSMCCS
jgi:hypothetical protein